MKKKKYFYLFPLFFTLVSCGDSLTGDYISFKEYIDIVNNETEEQKDIFIFTSSSCPHCQKIKPLLNRYIAENKDKNLNIYELSVDYKTNLKGQHAFKDETMGYLSGDSKNDCLKALDNRLTLYMKENQIQPSLENSIITGIEGNYLYVFTPLILWYQNGVEVKVVNNVEAMLILDKKNNFTYESFVTLMAYPEEKPKWNKHFDLDFYHS